MRTLPISASDDDILGVVRDWVSLLAAKDFEAAYALTDHDPYQAWTPDLIRRVIEGYGSPDPKATRHQVTAISEASAGLTPRHEVRRREEPHDGSAEHQTLGDVWFDLPLDGTWSDLSATFELRLRGEQLLLVLNEIHVF